MTKAYGIEQHVLFLKTMTFFLGNFVFPIIRNEAHKKKKKKLQQTRQQIVSF
jgi:hypothetical protein